MGGKIKLDCLEVGRATVSCVREYAFMRFLEQACQTDVKTLSRCLVFRNEFTTELRDQNSDVEFGSSVPQLSERDPSHFQTRPWLFICTARLRSVGLVSKTVRTLLYTFYAFLNRKKRDHFFESLPTFSRTPLVSYYAPCRWWGIK